MTLEEGVVYYPLCGILATAIYRIYSENKMSLGHLLVTVILWPLLVIAAILVFLNEVEL